MCCILCYSKLKGRIIKWLWKFSLISTILKLKFLKSIISKHVHAKIYLCLGDKVHQKVHQNSDFRMFVQISLCKDSITKIIFKIFSKGICNMKNYEIIFIVFHTYGSLSHISIKNMIYAKQMFETFIKHSILLSSCNSLN